MSGFPLYDFVQDHDTLLTNACQAKRLSVPVTDHALHILNWFPKQFETVTLAGAVQCIHSNPRSDLSRELRHAHVQPLPELFAEIEHVKLTVHGPDRVKHGAYPHTVTQSQTGTVGQTATDDSNGWTVKGKGKTRSKGGGAK